MKLSMSLDRLPMNGTVPAEQSGRLVARICVYDDRGFGRDVSLLADDHDQFELDKLVSMFRVFADHLERPTAA